VVAIVLVGLLAVRWHDSQPYSGDEPHYLLVSQSLIHDGDVDVKNDYLARRYLSYYPGHLDPHVNTSIFTLASPHWYSMHGVGLSAVLVPAVWADGAHGATVAMVVIAVIVLVLTFLWVRRFTGEIWLAAIATGALGLSPFFLGLEGRIFPDLPTAALLLGCLLLLELPRRRPRHLVLLGVLVGVSPWFHFKNAIAFGTIAALAFVQVARSPESGRDRVRQLLALAAPVLILGIGYELTIRAWYASWSPTRMVQPGNAVFALSEARGLAAVSFDSARGLLTNNPALLLILAGFPVWLRRYPGPVLRLALVLIPTILLQATFSDWAGAYAPAGRYALEFVPAYIPAVALLLQEVRIARVLAIALLGFQCMLALAFVWLRPPWGVGGERSPFFKAIDHHHGPPLDHAMPHFDDYTALVHGRWQLTAWVFVSCLLVCYGAMLAWKPTTDPVPASTV
jgi:hypothetical protein